MRNGQSNTMSNIKRFEYNGQRVTFQLEDGTSMVNATEMAKPFKKRPNDFLRTAGTKAFILALEEDYREQGIHKTVLHVVQDGKQLELQGTWMDEHLALKQAQAWGKAALALSQKHGVATGQTHDERYGKVRTYHSAILQRVILGK